MSEPDKINPTNQNGDTPTNKPSEKLINPPKKSGIFKEERKITSNATAKDYKLGDRHTTR